MLKYPEIDLILTDIKIPVMSFVEAARKIKLFRRNPPIIALTSITLSIYKQRCRGARCDDYMFKPIRQDELIGLIKK